MAGAAFRPYTKLAELLSYYSASIITSKTCQLKQLHRGYCVALDAVIRITGRGTPTTPYCFNDRLCPTLIQPCERILQS
jgi:hypothetical protein